MVDEHGAVAVQRDKAPDLEDALKVKQAFTVNMLSNTEITGH